MDKVKEISVFTLASKIFEKRVFVMKIVIVFLIVGLIVALTSPKEWKASIKLIPEDLSGDASLGGFEGLAGLAGVQLPAGQEKGMNPELYKEIVSSTPFLIALNDLRVSFDDDSLSLGTYFEEFQRRSILSKLGQLPSQIFSVLSSRSDDQSDPHKTFLFVSKADLEIQVELKKRVKISYDKKMNVVSITAEMQDPVLSAEVAQFTMDYVSNFVTNYELVKERRKLQFLDERLREKELDFRSVQDLLAEFRDMNQGSLNNRAKTILQNLESEYDLALNVYSNLQQQYEEAALRVEESTPVFSTLEPNRIPTYKHAPSRLLIIMLYSIVGLVIGIIFTGARIVLNELDLQKPLKIE